MAVQPNDREDDALVREVRAIRQAISESCGHDVDRLCDQLASVERAYAAHEGPFAGVSRQAAADVAQGWGEEAQRQDDALIDEVRAMRQASSNSH